MDLRYPARRLVIYLAGTCGVPRAYLAPDLAPEPPGGYDLQLAERALLIRGSRHLRGGAAVIDANKSMRIFEANRHQIHDPNLIFPGQVLRIPQ